MTRSSTRRGGVDRHVAGHGRLRATVAAVVLAVALAGILGVIGSAAPQGAMADTLPAVPAQSARFYVPNAQTAGSPEEALAQMVPAGMDGMGETEIELQNLGNGPLGYDAQFVSIVAPDVIRSGVLPPLGGERFGLSEIPGFEFSNYNAGIAAGGPFGGIVRTTWFGGASTTHEVVPPSTDLILPLVVREVFSHSTIIFIQNIVPVPFENPNPVVFTLFDSDGSVLESWTVPMKGTESLPDDLYRERNFYEKRLPKNSAGGFIGAFHATSREPVAILLYGDEPVGIGSYALNARPRSAAARAQYLPLVRANFMGDTLFTVTNADIRPVDVSVAYHGHPYSPSGANQTYRQAFRLMGSNTATIDLGPRERGSIVAAAIPRGEAPGEGFLGNVTITSSGPVMAAAWEQDLEEERVAGSAAYNAFGPADLGTVFVVPHAFGTPDSFPTFLVVMNPGDSNASVTASLLTDDGERYATLGTYSVEGGGGMGIIPVSTTDYGHVRVLAESSSPVAVLAVDGLPVRDRTIHMAVRLPDSVRGTFPTPSAPLTPTAGPGWTPTPTGTLVRPTAMPSPTSGIVRLSQVYMPWTGDRGARRR